MSITKVTSPQVIRIAAAGYRILCSWKAVLSTLAGAIPPGCAWRNHAVAIRYYLQCRNQSLISAYKVNVGLTRNTIIMAVTLTLGIGGAVLSLPTLHAW